MQELSFDIIVIGGGMAGVSIAFELSKSKSVLLLEREENFAVHATGRSAAAFIGSYGYQNDCLYTLSKESFDFLKSPPASFSSDGFLDQRGLLTIASSSYQDTLESEYHQLKKRQCGVQWLQDAQIKEKLPCLSEKFQLGAIFESEVYDIDVHRLHTCYLQGLKKLGGKHLTKAEVTTIFKTDGQWQVHTKDQEFFGSVVVNATGAWADEVATKAGIQPLGLTPHRRTAILVDSPLDPISWPLVMDLETSFYFKPDAGLILASPADETPSPACDSAPEEIDIATAAHLLEGAINTEIKVIRHSWSGLRTFASDKTPVIGFDGTTEDFFWFAGQGGHGIQTAPASARLAAGLISGSPSLYGADTLMCLQPLCSPTRLRRTAGVSIQEAQT